MTTAAAPLRTGLTAPEIAAWRAEGFVAVPDFFTPAEVALLQRAVGELQAAGKLRNVHTTGDGRTPSTTAFNLQLCPAGPHHRAIRALPYAAKVRAAVAALLGDDIVHHLDQIFLKPARHGVGTNWHTDNAYFRSREVDGGTGLWIAVHAATRANGTMTIVPGSHRREWRHERDGGSDHHITCAAEVDPARALPIELPAGGVLFFNYGVVHSTGPNATDGDRAGLALHFVRRDRLVAGGFPDAAQRPLGTACDGGRAVHGEDLRGAWEAMAGSAR